MPHRSSEFDRSRVKADAGHSVVDRELLTILCIEDNFANFQLIRSIFSYEPRVQLIWASSGGEGIASARSRRPGLVLLDVHLPDASGEDVLRQLKSDPSTSAIPVLALTADARIVQRERLLAAGADAFFTKPIEISKLRAFVAGIRAKRSYV